jgi:hypothetical protein
LPDKPNHEEFGKPVVDGDTDATDVYDQRYGSYQDQVTKTSPAAKPTQIPVPFKVG